MKTPQEQVTLCNIRFLQPHAFIRYVYVLGTKLSLGRNLMTNYTEKQVTKRICTHVDPTPYPPTKGSQVVALHYQQRPQESNSGASLPAMDTPLGPLNQSSVPRVGVL